MKTFIEFVAPTLAIFLSIAALGALAAAIGLGAALTLCAFVFAVVAFRGSL